MNLKFESEKDLIAHLNKGNRHAFIFVVNQYYDILYLYAFGLTNERNIAEDIVQEVFFRLWSKRENLFVDTSLKSFLYRAIHNEFVDHYRKKKKEISYLDRISINIVQSIFHEADQEYLSKIEKVNREIEALPEKCKEVFILSKKEGLTNQEIAQYLNVSLKTVEGHISKAFKIIRNSFKSTKFLFLFLKMGSRHRFTSIHQSSLSLALTSFLKNSGATD